MRLDTVGAWAAGLVAIGFVVVVVVIVCFFCFLDLLCFNMCFVLCLCFSFVI